MPNDPEHLTTPPDGKPLESQPKWRRDFPIDLPEDEYVARRDLVKFMVLTSGAFAAGHLWLLGRALTSPPPPSFAVRAIAGVDDLPVGGSLTFDYPEGGGAPCLLIRAAEDRFLAYDQRCTHLLCPVQARVEEGTLHCPCHNGYFDLETGEPVAGPPRRPLPRVRLEVRGDVVYATGVQHRGVSGLVGGDR